MKLFIDTANIEDIKAAAEMGVIHGVTTNPSLISKEGRSFREVIREIVELVDGPISAEVLAADHEGMIKEGMEFAGIHKNIVIKIPMTEEGLKAVKILSENGIKTNVTLIFSAAQALLAANAGAVYVSPFIGRIDDIGYDGMNLITEINDVFADGDFDTKIIAASIRSSLHVIDAARAGADFATVPASVIRKMVTHPLTDAGLEKFAKDWAANGVE